MTKLSRLLTYIAVGSIVLTGCSTSNREAKSDFSAGNAEKSTVQLTKQMSYKQAPVNVKLVKAEAEYVVPYIKAVEQMNVKNTKLAKKYLDLTIADFPNTKHSYRAQVLKTVILLSEMIGNVNVNMRYLKGIEEYMNSDLGDADGIQKLKKMMDKLSSEHESTKKQLDQSISLVLKNYSQYKNISIYKTPLNFPLKKTDVSNDLILFEKIGYPIPRDYVIEQDFKNSREKYLSMVILVTFENKKVNYPNIFLYAGGAIGTSDKSKKVKLLQEVIKLTEGDKYNEARLEAQEQLKEMNKK
ncbi:hypothetical protein [Paenibacillus tuaregi]|uniref:hypothetical protein n=1 Tax=Paenibacillus tuaregi TaxID=1816681 RepID=UPI00083971C4|nr:hypothetical protein [Paenibacillus tuaregi]